MSNQERITEADDVSNEETVSNTEQETSDEAESERLVEEIVILEEGEETFVTEKRLTDSDLDEAVGYLSIPEPEFNNALQFLSRIERMEIESDRSLQVSMVDYKGIQPVVKSLALRYSLASYRFTRGWNQVMKANEEKFRGVNGLHAVIQLYYSRPSSGICFALKLKQPEVLDGLKTRLQFMLYASEPVLFAEKRLTDCDLGQDASGSLSLPELSIPEDVITNAIPFTTAEKCYVELGLGVTVTLLQYIDDMRVQTPMEITGTQGESYLLTGNWDVVIKRNEKKFIGVSGLHAVIQLWFFRYDGSRLCFALDIAEEAKTDAEANTSNEKYYIGDEESTSSHGSGSINTNTRDEDRVNDETARTTEQETNIEAKVERRVEESVFLRGKDTFVKATFLTQKRLTDSDLDEDKGCLSIPEDEFKNAFPFLSRTKKEEIESGRSMPVTLIELNGVDQQKVNSNMLLRKSATSYELAGAWNEIKRANEEKFRGVDGLHAVIQLSCFLVGEEIQFMLVKEPEIPERLNKFVESMQGASKPQFITQKRLSEFDLDQNEGCLLIPDGLVDKANLFRVFEMDLLNLSPPLPVCLIDINGDKHFETDVMLYRKPNKDFSLTEGWNEFVRRNEKKLMGIDGSRAVIQLWLFRDQNFSRDLELYFALNIAEEAYRGDAEEASTSHGSGPSNTETGDAEA